MNARHASIRRKLLFAWLIPAALAITACLVTFGILGWRDHQGALIRAEFDLIGKTQAASRRLSAELLLGRLGSPETVAQALKSDFALETLEVSNGDFGCSDPNSAVHPCVQHLGSRLLVTTKIPFIQQPRYVRAESASPTWSTSLNPSILILGTFPILLMLGAGLGIQLRLLRRGIIEPVETLAAHAGEPGPIPGHWPQEFVDLSEELRKGFLQRDHALIGQLAGGLIHDLKTLTHTLLTATELAREQSEDSPKRLPRLKGLLRACTVQLPKMNSIIDSTLDSTREVRLNRKPADLKSTIQSAIQLHSSSAEYRKVEIQVTLDPDLQSVLHDPIQLERAISNLIKNAIEAFDGTNLTRKHVCVSAQRNDKLIHLRVEDSGPGLGTSPGLVLDSLRSSKVHGTGFGLWVSRKIIEAHQGQIIAGQSKDLLGASFEILLPTGTGGTV